MKACRLSQLAVGAAIAVSSLAAQATVAFGTGLNDIEIITRENQYRSTTACDLAPGSCLGAGTGPGTLQLVNPGVINNVQNNDIFIGVFASRSVTASGITVWDQDNNATGGIDTFTGYFVQEVKDVQFNVAGTTDRIILGTSSIGDPFGILGAGQIAAAFVDTTGLANTAHRLDGVGLTLLQSIQSVTDGALWAAFSVGNAVLGSGVDSDGYMTTEADIGVAGNSNAFNGNFYTAWNVAATGPAYNVGVLTGINDPVENVKGGTLAGDPFTTGVNNAAGVCAAVVGSFACNDIVGNGQITPNANASFSPWLFSGEDPLQLYQIPEPSSLALVGLALAGLGLAARRRRAV